MEELLATISSDEIADWAAYYQLDPFGSYRSDLQMGIMVSNLLAPHLKKGATPLKPADFMPVFGEPAKDTRMTPQAIHDTLARMFKRSRRG